MNTGKPRLPDQTGTWKFISAARQLDPLSEPHLAMDDMESVFWAFLYLALRYGIHDLSGERIKEQLQVIFEERSVADGIMRGGNGKNAVLTNSKPWPNGSIPTRFTPNALNNVLISMQDVFQPRYLDLAAKVTNKGEDAKMARAYLIKQREDEIKHLDNPRHLRELIKGYTSLDWSKDHGPIVHELPRSPEEATGPSASNETASKV